MVAALPRITDTQFNDGARKQTRTTVNGSSQTTAVHMD